MIALKNGAARRTWAVISLIAIAEFSAGCRSDGSREPRSESPRLSRRLGTLDSQAADWTTRVAAEA
jgi:hypothetical protein